MFLLPYTPQDIMTQTSDENTYKNSFFSDDKDVFSS